jgi:2,3-bisphosphoglycerate-independent phosphoglycerate mutase
MLKQDLIKSLSRSTPSRIVLLVIDGMGGLPHPVTGKTELETAMLPNLDALVSAGVCGLSVPVSAGITPGSAPGHTALFGYNPLEISIGRGVLEAVGIDFPAEKGDVFARGNFCTVDGKGNIADRRAGRISTELNAELCPLLEMTIDGIKVLTAPVREHRFVVCFRGKGLSPQVTESDPQMEGIPPNPLKALDSSASKMAQVANTFVQKAAVILKDRKPANMILMRGFSQTPSVQSMKEIYQLKCAAIATYPMYRGLARLVGMDILATGQSFEDEIDTLKKNFTRYDFFFIHYKKTDAAGEDGDFDRKVKSLEELDSLIPEIMKLKPEVVVVTGDHSTPAILKAHSWHPVPTILNSLYCRSDDVTEFTEKVCLKGGLGMFPATDIMPLAMANALKLNKYGA